MATRVHLITIIIASLYLQGCALFSEMALVEWIGKKSRGTVVVKTDNPGELRQIDLFCDRPPHPGVVLNNLWATLQQPQFQTQGSAAIDQSLGKFFEQTERTLLIQYALFRVCELGINAGLTTDQILTLAGTILRQSVATLMAGEADIERARALPRLARERTLQEGEKTRQAKIELLTKMANDDKLKMLITPDVLRSAGFQVGNTTK